MLIFASEPRHPRTFAAQPTPDPDVEAFAQIADRQTPAVQRAVYRALAGLADSTDLRALADAIARGDVNLAGDALDFAGLEVALRSAVAERLRTVLVESGQRAMGDLAFLPAEVTGHAATLVGRFDLVDPLAIEWIDRHVGTLVREITTEQRAGLVDLVHDAFQTGQAPPDVLARQIRQRIGLTRRQQQSVANYQQQLQATQDGGKATFRSGQAESMVGRYQHNLLRYRSETIARTETFKASNAGRDQAWGQAVASGLVDTGQVERVWIVTNDATTCEECRPLNGARAPIGGVFPGGHPAPPAHPRCRCSSALVRATTPQKRYVQDLPEYMPRQLNLKPAIPASARRTTEMRRRFTHAMQEDH